MTRDFLFVAAFLHRAVEYGRHQHLTGFGSLQKSLTGEQTVRNGPDALTRRTPDPRLWPSVSDLSGCLWLHSHFPPTRTTKTSTE